MALINCPECSHMMSTKAKSCPNCGAVKEREMEEGEQRCGHCGSINMAEATACKNCGAMKARLYTTMGYMNRPGISAVLFIFLIVTVLLPPMAISTVPVGLWFLYGFIRQPRWYK